MKHTDEEHEAWHRDHPGVWCEWFTARSALEASAVPTRDCPTIDCERHPASAVPEPTDLRAAIEDAAYRLETLDGYLVKVIEGSPLEQRFHHERDVARVAGELRALAATPPGPHTSREEEPLVCDFCGAVILDGDYDVHRRSHHFRPEPTREAEGRDHDDD